MARSIRTARVERMAALLRYLGDPSRVALVLYLQQQGGGLYVHEIADLLEITHSAASHQLATLEGKGIVEGVREGQMVRYQLSRTPVAQRVLRLLRALDR